MIAIFQCTLCVCVYMNVYSMYVYTHIFTYIFIYVYTDIFVFIFMYMELYGIVWKCELSEIINNNYGVAVYTNID